MASDLPPIRPDVDFVSLEKLATALRVVARYGQLVPPELDERRTVETDIVELVRRIHSELFGGE